MEKSKPVQAVRLVVANPLTKEQAEKKLKALAVFIRKTWKH
jgi:hypothetical protein